MLKKIKLLFIRCYLFIYAIIYCSNKMFKIYIIHWRCMEYSRKLIIGVIDNDKKNL